MINLYFSSGVRIASTALIMGAVSYIIYVLKNLKGYEHWGRTFAILFFLGLFMSIISGTRDAIGTPCGFPTKGTIFIILCGLGILGFIVGLAALISKLFNTNVIFQYGSFVLMAIIIIKTLLVESLRIYSHYR